MRPKTEERPKTAVALVGENIHSLLERLNDLQDREIAIMGAALVDAVLAVAIHTRLSDKWSNQIEKVVHRMVGSASNKIYFAYFMNIIPKLLFHDLCKINDVRNRFAHDFFPRDFDTDEGAISGNCRGLALPKHHAEIFSQIHAMNKAHLGPEREHRDDGYPDNGYYIVDAFGAVIANVVVEDSSLTTNRARFLKSVKLAWIFSQRYLIHSCLRRISRRSIWRRQPVRTDPVLMKASVPDGCQASDSRCSKEAAKKLGEMSHPRRKQHAFA